MSVWPFVGRGGELDAGLSALRPDSGLRGLVLCGESGVGKTALARAIAESLRVEGHATRFVLGTETGRLVPLGAFQRVVSVGTHEPAVMLAAAYRELSADESTVVVIDDAHLLDPLSALLVQQLAEGGVSRLIVTIRSGERMADSITALWKEHMLLRLDVQPFARSQVAELAGAVLGGAVDGELVDRLFRMATGNPLFLRGLLNAALADGVLVERDGCWRLNGRLRIATELVDLIGMRLASLESDERDVIEIVSTAEVLDWNVLFEVCDSAAIERTERRGFIQVVDDGEHTSVRPGHPLIGEVIRQRCGAVHTRQLNARLARHLSDYLDAHGDAGHRHVDAFTGIQLAQFMMRSDVVPDIDAVIGAAESAITTANLVLGEQLARFALGRGGGLRAALALADSVSWQGRGEEADRILATHEPRGVDDMARVRWGCLRAANLFFGCGRRDDARATLAALRPVIPESLQGDLMATEVAIAFFEADVSTALRDGRSVLAGELSPLATVWAAMATACALAFSGRFAEVAAIAEQGLRAAESCESGPQRYALGLAEVLGQLGAGDLAGAEQVCRRYAARAFGVPEADAIVSALEGRVLMAHGKLPAACEAFTKSLWTMSGALPAGWVMLVASWLAQAAGARGESGMAAEALARAEAADGPQVAVFGPELELARAWVQAASDQTTAARDHARRAAWMARSAGASAVELVALHAALRFGERSAASRLDQLSSTLDGPLVAAVRVHGLGLYRANGDLLDDAGMQFERLGATALAADAYAHAAGAHARAGARTSELESVARAQSLARQCGSSTPATRGVSQPLPITDREREIAGLVAAGLTNREVADCLGLSVRTVDGHLYRIFGKLGVGDRDQLKRLVGEPVIPTGDNPSRKRSSLQA